MTQTKTFTIDTNFNQKLKCDTFVHVDLAPANPVRESTMDNTIVEFKTKDGSHPPVQCKLVDLARFPLDKANNIVTMVSHGMTTLQFIDWMFGKYKNLSPKTEMAVYFYQKHMAE